MNYSKMLLSGNIGRRPETKDINGLTITNFSVACNYTQGEQKKTDWYNCKAFGRLAELLSKADKGTKVVVLGTLHIEEYEKDGSKRTASCLTIEKVLHIGVEVADKGEKIMEDFPSW